MNELSLLTEENVPRSLLIITDGFKVTWKCSSWVSAAVSGLIAHWKHVDPFQEQPIPRLPVLTYLSFFFLIKILVT